MPRLLTKNRNTREDVNRVIRATCIVGKPTLHVSYDTRYILCSFDGNVLDTTKQKQIQDEEHWITAYNPRTNLTTIKIPHCNYMDGMPTCNFIVMVSSMIMCYYIVQLLMCYYTMYKLG